MFLFINVPVHIILPLFHNMTWRIVYMHTHSSRTVMFYYYYCTKITMSMKQVFNCNTSETSSLFIIYIRYIILPKVPVNFCCWAQHAKDLGSEINCSKYIPMLNKKIIIIIIKRNLAHKFACSLKHHCISIVAIGIYLSQL